MKRPPQNDFTEEEQNFWQRFGVFHVCHEPQPLSYADFASYTSSTGVPPSQLFAMAAEYFTQVRGPVQQLLGLPPGIVTAEQVRVALSRYFPVRRGGDAGQNTN